MKEVKTQLNTVRLEAGREVKVKTLQKKQLKENLNRKKVLNQMFPGHA